MIIETAADLLGYDPDEFVASKRIYGAAKTNRDLVMVLIWETGAYTNEAIGGLFHVTYSSVSRSVSSFKESLKKLYDKIKSQIKM